MPTGYTAKVQEGASFEEFVWGCARAFGAFVMMRDDPSDAPIPDHLKPGTYNAQRLTEATERLAEVRRMSDADLTIAAQAEYEKERAYKIEADQKDKDTQAKYVAMIERVMEWEPPTSEHEGLKKFMLQQLKESLKFDCGFSREEPVLLTGDEWREKQVSQLERDIAYHTEEQGKENERTAGRNKWIADLRNSVSIPAALKA